MSSPVPMSNPNPNDQSSLIRPLAERSVVSLLRWSKSQSKKLGKNNVSDPPIHLILSIDEETIVISPKSKSKIQSVSIPHCIPPISTTIILIRDDRSKNNIYATEDSVFTFPDPEDSFLSVKGKNFPLHVVTFSTFTSTHASTVSRRNFFSSPDVKFVDSRLFQLLDKEVGGRVFEKKRKRLELFQIELASAEGRVRWKEQIEKRLGSTEMKLKNGASVLVGRVGGLEKDEIVDNVVRVVCEVTKRLSCLGGGWQSLREASLKTDASIPLPVYQTNTNADSGDGFNKQKEEDNKIVKRRRIQG
ncbi:hypothetical protein ZOSMA_1G00740 [Zostera marina]|uniref:Uncharacterized protein n=1 Tax=Zostera marina TaxID=29655 RepID=A0A0K9PM42_ZOSMR|nr:hypothetical protein ZOSMA_1G00740 [Zostera marina]